MSHARDPKTAATPLVERRMRGLPLARVMRLARKELREILRDRRTIVTLVLMPIIVYPLLSLAFQRFLVSTLQPAGTPVLRIGVATAEEGESVRQLMAVQGDENFRGELLLVENLEQELSQGNIDLAIRITPRSDRPPLPNGRLPVVYTLTILDGGAYGEQLRSQIERRLAAANEGHLQQRLRERGEVESIPVRIERTVVKAAPSGSTSLKTLVPLILVLMTITGAVYPAIDLTAGERERGTLEMLVAAPVPRLELMLGKYVAVLTVALLTATANLAAMTTTIFSMGLGKLVLGDSGLTPLVVLQVFGLLVLFAAFFSAVLLTLTSFARSFKEAQAYLIPLMMISIAPGLLSLTPDLKLNGFLAVTPLVNIVLLARDLFAGTPVSPMLAAVTIFSTLLFALAALGLAARVFGTDAILYGSQGNWSDLWRGTEPKQTANVSSAMLCLALLFPALFLVNNALAQVAQDKLAVQLMLRGGAQLVLFAGIPMAAAWLSRVNLAEGFSLRGAPLATFLGAAIMGLSMWPLAFQVIMLAKHFGLAIIDAQRMEAVAEFVESLRSISPLWVVLAFGVLPAISEELFFRGYLYGALRARASAATAVLVSAIIFGLFHLIAIDSLAIERLLPTTLIGLALGWVRLQTRSVLPGMVLHTLHNSLLLLIAYYQKDVSAFLGLQETTQDFLPWTWILAGGFVAAAGALLIALTRPRDPVV